MNESPTRSFARATGSAAAGTAVDFDRKAGLCASVLVESTRLSRDGRQGAPLRRLIARACELLDELDELLVTLRPSRDSREVATAAVLHRELEHVQDAVAAPPLVPGSAPRLASRH
jgi:hypothetical protein